MNQPLRAAVIGCGRMGARSPIGPADIPAGWLPLTHAGAIAEVEGIELTAVCDMNEDFAHAAAADFAVRPYADHRLMLEEVKPDILSIATRTPGRADLIAFAAKSGVRGIHAEKPFANSLDECDTALEAVRDVRGFLTYGTTRRFMNAYREARRLIETGEIGPVHEIAVDHGQTWIMWNHAHSVDLLMYFAGSTDVEFVQANCSFLPGRVSRETVDDDPILEYGYMRFANGVNGLITSAGGYHTRISGSKGTLTILGDGDSIEIRRASGTSGYYADERRLRPTSPHSGTVQAFTELRDALVNETPPSITPGEIRTGLEALFGFVRSSLDDGRRIRLNEIDPAFRVTGRRNGPPA